MRRADFDRERAVATVIDIIGGGILTEEARRGAFAREHSPLAPAAP
jgi:hypothetical protein